MYNGPIFPQQQQPKCCGCISLRLGSGIICLIWAAFSMYLAVLSFQNSSLFYSYLPQAAFTVYGVVNLILSLVSVGGLVILIINVGRYVRTLSHAIFVSMFLVLVDGFINVILFITNQSNFYNWCVDTSSKTIVSNMNNHNSTISFDFTSSDFYNCHNLWQDELKFGIIFYILMFAFYVYWALCVYSFSLVRREYYTSADIRDAQATAAGIPMMGAPPVVGPPPGLAVPPPTATANGFPSDRSVIVLNNSKPASKVASSKKKQQTGTAFSFRNLKKSVLPASSSSSVAPMLPQQQDHLSVPFTLADRRGDQQFTIGFRLGPDGNIIDIENASGFTAQQQPAPPAGSPTPTFINNGSQVVFYDSNQQQQQQREQQQLKRKPVTKDDHYNYQYDDSKDTDYY